MIVTGGCGETSVIDDAFHARGKESRTHVLEGSGRPVKQFKHRELPAF